jgi:hypothetical protein
MRHVLRKEKTEPGYLLPREHRHPTFVVGGSAETKLVLRRFEQKMEMRTGQAKARGSSPFWEGVLVLSSFSGSYQDYGKSVADRLREWATEYQRITGHAVLHISVHLDEGAVIDGNPHYNEHAHVQIDRTDEAGRVIKLGRSKLSQVQDMTARVMKMERGETLEQRGGKRGRKHMGHHDYRRYAAAKREAEQNYELGVDHGTEAVAEDARRMAQKAADSSDRRGMYLELRGLLKGSGKAIQSDYSDLKKLYERQDEHFERLGAYVQQDEPDVLAVLDYLRPVSQNDYESPCP